MQAGMDVETVVGDAAYSEKGNIEYTSRKEIKMVAKLNPSVAQGYRKKEDEFEFNKDAGMYVCKAGHMAIRKAKHAKGRNVYPKTKWIHTILTLKNVKSVHSEKAVTNLEPKARAIR